MHTCSKHGLPLVQRDGFDGGVVGLEGVEELGLPQVPDTDLFNKRKCH